MSGLLEKDMRLLAQRKSSLAIFFVIALIMGISVGGEFIVAYCMIMAITLSVSTISYDEYDNGFPFLMSLPITKKMYVTEKYVLVLGVMLITGVFADILCVLSYLVKGEAFSPVEMLLSSFIVFLGMFIVVSVMIPAQIKFGAEKSRMVLIVLMGACFACAYGGRKLFDLLHINGEELLTKINSVNQGVVIIGMVLLVSVFVALSIFVSNRILEKKEF